MSNDVTRILPREPDALSRPMAIISDIHSNILALRAVLEDIARRGIERVVCLGDVIGYGANPVECWRLVRETCDTVIRGNHDQALGSTGLSRFHPRARKAMEWTRRRLLEEEDGAAIIDAITNLPRLVREKEYLYVHGSPADPTMDYLLPGDAFDKPRMEREFALVDVYAFNGHTHIPGVVEKGRRFMPPEAFSKSEYFMTGIPAIINAGSVGQPRDGDPRACYLTIEANVARYHRVEYDAEEACARIVAVKELDPFLGRRLLAGY